MSVQQDTHGFDAIASESQDLLDRGPFVRRLVDVVIDPKKKTATGVTVGITGPWGSGKSSILRLLAEEIDRQYGCKAIVVEFDPWLVSGADDLIGQFFGDLAASLKPHIGINVETNASSEILDFAAEISPLANMVFPGAGALLKGSVAATRSRLEKSKTLQARRERIEHELSRLAKPIVVLIDELDRTEDEEIRTVARLIRSVADFPSISYVVAFDFDRVAQALGKKNSALGKTYLEKIIHFSIPLPINIEGELDRIANDEISLLAEEIELPSDWREGSRYQSLLRTLFSGLIKTPRDVKRFVWTLRALGGSAIRGEVDWVDLVGVSALYVKAPGAVANIQKDPNLVVEDPYSLAGQIQSLIQEDNSEGKLTSKVFPLDEQLPEVLELARFLFPTFRTQDDEDKNTVPVNAVRFRRPLLTVFRFGILPGQFSLNEVASLFELPIGNLIEKIRTALHDGRIELLLDRIEEVLPTTPSTKHLTFWSAFANAVGKPDCEWMTSYSPMHILTRELQRIFERYYSRNDRDTGGEILKSLLNLNDLALAPEILRSQLFEHGLFGQKKREVESPLLSKEDTETLCRSLSRSYRERHLGGQFVSCLWNLQPVFLMMNTGDWDAECREALQEQVRNGGVDGMALHLYGGSYSTDAATVDRLIGKDWFQREVGQRLKHSNIDEQDGSVATALNKAVDPF